MYRWLSFKWEQLGGDITGEVGGDEAGSAVSLSKDGSRLAVGAAQEKSKGKGKVRVYHYDDDLNWIKLGADLVGEADEDMFGSTVAISGSGARLAVGAPYHDPGGLEKQSAGHVRVFEWNKEAWSPMGNAINGNVKGDMSGWSVSLSDDGSRLALGGIQEDASFFKDMSVSTNGTPLPVIGNNWVQILRRTRRKIILACPCHSQLMALTSQSAQRMHDSDGEDTKSNIGHVKVYRYNDTSGSWQQLGEDIDGKEKMKNLELPSPYPRMEPGWPSAHPDTTILYKTWKILAVSQFTSTTRRRTGRSSL